MDSAFVARAEAYLGLVLRLAGFKIQTCEHISGNGISRTVLRLGTTSSDTPAPTFYVLLLEQSASPVDSNRQAEFSVLRSLARHPAVAVAEAVWLEADPAPLGAPFLLTSLLPGTSNPKLLMTPPCAPHARRIVAQSFSSLGSLAALDVEAIDLGRAFPLPTRDDIWRIELERCERIIRDCACDDSVVTHAAIRHLRRARPATPVKVSVVHGDYRLGNFMFDESGLTGIVDWEMVHFGHPLEDLAWALLPLWEFRAHPGRPGGCLSLAEATAAWESTSQIAVAPDDLAWWTLFCHVKAMSIWARARQLFASGQSRNVMPALVGYARVEKQESYMARLLMEATP